MKRNRYNDVIEIDLVVLCKKALKKWKMILLFCLLGAVAGAGIANARYWWNENHEPEFKEEDLNKSKARLTDRELEEADHVFNQYSTYFRVQDEREKHINESLLMGLNAETASVLERRYLIGSDQSDLVDNLEHMTLNPAGYRRIALAAGNGLTEQDVEEMIIMTPSPALQKWEDIVLDGNAAVKGSDSPEATDNGVSRDHTDTKYSNVITVTAMGNDEASCKKLLDEAENLLKEAVDELKPLDRSLSMTPFGEDPVKDGVETILKRQQELLESVTAIINIRKQFNQDVVNKLTKNQKAYFEQLQLRDNAKEPESKDSRGMMKFAAVGFFLGAVICFVIICYPFLLGGHYQSAGELESSTGIRRIATFKEDKSGAAGVDVKFATKMLVEELRAWKKNDTDIFYFVTDEKFTFNHPFCNQLKFDCDDNSLLIGNPLEKPTDMADMLKSNGIILGISVEKSRRETAKRIYCTACDHEIPVLGYVAEDTL